MPFLGLDSAPSTSIEDLLQQDRLELAKVSAEATPFKALMRGLGSFVDELSGLVGLGEDLNGLGATPTRGTRGWWIWYATVYLPQYYSAQQIQQYVYASPYYNLFGSPYGGYQQPYYPQSYNYGQQYPYQYGNPYAYQYNSPYNYGQYGYGTGYGQQGYNYYYGDQEPSQCQAGGGYWDYGQNVCYQQNQLQNNPTTQPPNVVGMPEGAAIAALNGAGFNVWEINVNGQSRGAPPGYSNNRVSISVQNGSVTAQAVG